ncbi:MAG: hypothetical protein ABJU19_16860 [Roseobacter sp.]
MQTQEQTSKTVASSHDVVKQNASAVESHPRVEPKITDYASI